MPRLYHSDRVRAKEQLDDAQAKLDAAPNDPQLVQSYALLVAAVALVDIADELRNSQAI